MGNLSSFQKEFGLIVVGAVIFIASFLWKDLLVDIEDYYFPQKSSIVSRIIYTIVLTIILITIAIYLKSAFGISKPDDNNFFDDSPIDKDSYYGNYYDNNMDEND